MSKFQYIKFAVDMKKAMRRHGLTTHDVAILSGISQTSVARIARAEEKNPHMQTWLKICDALELEPKTYIR